VRIERRTSSILKARFRYNLVVNQWKPCNDSRLGESQIAYQQIVFQYVTIDDFFVLMFCGGSTSFDWTASSAQGARGIPKKAIETLGHKNVARNIDCSTSEFLVWSLQTKTVKLNTKFPRLVVLRHNTSDTRLLSRINNSI
jgi:hypothetical protein